MLLPSALKSMADIQPMRHAISSIQPILTPCRRPNVAMKFDASKPNTDAQSEETNQELLDKFRINRWRF